MTCQSSTSFFWTHKFGLVPKPFREHPGTIIQKTGKPLGIVPQTIPALTWGTLLTTLVIWTVQRQKTTLTLIDQFEAYFKLTGKSLVHSDIRNLFSTRLEAIMKLEIVQSCLKLSSKFKNVPVYWIFFSSCKSVWFTFLKMDDCGGMFRWKVSVVNKIKAWKRGKQSRFYS